MGRTHFGPVFLGFSPEIDPGTPLDRRGLPGTSICTKNQPRRPTLRPNGGERKIPLDCLQVLRDKGLLGFQNRPVSGPHVLDICGLNCFKPI